LPALCLRAAGIIRRGSACQGSWPRSRANRDSARVRRIAAYFCRRAFWNVWPGSGLGSGKRLHSNVGGASLLKSSALPPPPECHAEEDRNYFFQQVPTSCDFMAEPVETQCQCSPQRFDVRLTQRLVRAPYLRRAIDTLHELAPIPHFKPSMIGCEAQFSQPCRIEITTVGTSLALLLLF